MVSLIHLTLQRDFSSAKKKKGGKKGAGQQSDAESSSVESAEPEEDRFAAATHSRAEEAVVDQSLFKPFSLGDVRKIQSTPDHQVKHLTTNSIIATL